MFLYPVVIAAAAALAWHSRTRSAGRGPAWFAGWALAGFLVSSSFLTGLSIGIFIFPLAATVLLSLARLSPHLPEAVGALVGIAATAVMIAVISVT